MKLMFKIIILFICLICFAQMGFALQITSPQEGQVVYQGDRLSVIVKPDLGEMWEEVLLGIFPMTYDALTNEYKEEIEIPSDAIGNISFNVLAYNGLNEKIKLTRSLFVEMPPNVVLKSIVAGSSVAGGLNFISLRKMPPDSSAADIERYETEQLSVYGRYSDNINRELTSSASGTTYSSSNEQVVTVSPEGKVTAKGIGNAKIIVSNEDYSATVDVVVKPYQ